MSLGHPLFFRASVSCSKILNVKSICSIQWKIWMQTLFFRACACKLLKIPECIMYIPYSEIFQGTLCFSGQAQVTQNSWIIKNTYSSTVKNIRATLFFRERASCLKILKVKSIFHTAKFLGNSAFSGQAQVAQNSWMHNVYSIQWNIPGQLCFSGQAQVTQNSWIIKKIYSVQ